VVPFLGLRNHHIHKPVSIIHYSFKNMFYRLLTYLFTLLFLTPFLTGCLGGGGGSEAPQDSLIDARVATVKVIISNDFQPADGKSAITVTVIAQDAQTASVAGIPVSLFSSSDTAFLEVLSGQTEETGRFTTTVTDSVAEEVHITATAGGVKSSPVNLHFVSSAYDPRVAKLELVVANDFQLADGKSFINFTVVVRDANNTPIPNVQLSLGSASNSASFESVSGKTAQNGRFSTTMTNSVAEKVEVTATAGGKTERTLLTFVSVVNDERVAEVKLTVSNNYQYADGFAKVNLTVIAIDRDGVPLSGVGVSFSSTSASAVFEAFKGRTDDAGRFSTTLTNSIPETIQVTANAGGVRSLPMDVTFISTVGSIFINASAMVLNVGESSKVTVTLLSNLLVNIEDILLGKSLGDFLTDPAVSADTEKAVLDALLEKKVLLPQTPFNVVASGTATLSGVTGTTDERGQATFTISDNTAEDVTLTITSGTASQTLILHFGASITLIPTSVNAIGTTKLRALLRDGKKAPLGGQTISFNFHQVINETLFPASVVTNPDGTAEVTVTDLGNDGGTVIVNANSGSLNAQATVNFLVGQDNLIDERVATVKVIISNDFQPADGKSTITVTVIAQDAQTAPVADVPVSLFSSSDTAFLAALRGQTKETGRFTTTVTDSVAEEVKITATAGGIKSTPVNLHFMAGAVERVTTVKVIISNDFQPADGKSAITVTVIAQDVQSAPVAGIPVSLFTSSDTAFLEALSGPTEETGRFTTTVTDSVAEEVKITATAGGIKSTPVSLHFVSSAYDTRVAKVELVVTNDSQPTDGKSSVTLSVVVRDASNMPIPDVQVYLGSTSNSALFQTVSGKTGENGRFTTTVTDTVAEK
jgi:adhesin/invasin